MATHQITCKEKHSLYERVISVGCVEVDTGVFKRFSEDEAITRIKQRTDSFYVEKPKGHRVWLIVAQREGREYLKTETDGERPDNLLEQPDCPVRKPEPSGSRRTVIAAPSHGEAPDCSRCWLK
jgi:Protein of unknown function (DUF3892)